MALNLKDITLNGGALFSGLADVNEQTQTQAARGVATSPSHGGLPSEQGGLEAQFAVDIRATEQGGHHSNQPSQEMAMLHNRIAELRRQLREQREAFDLRHPVDEYESSFGLPAQGTITGAYPDGVTGVVQLTADWTIPERIESYIVTIPVGTTLAVMKLGNRMIGIYQGTATTGIQTFQGTGLGVILNEDDDRLLLLGGTLTAGPTHFELMGFAHEIWGNA